MSDSPGFFSDPKTILSLLAIVISVVSLIWTLAAQHEQNRRWDAQNLSRVELTDVGLVIWKQMTREQATSTNWGYKPTLYSTVQNRVHTDMYQVPYELILVDSSRKRVPNSNGFFTLAEGAEEARRIGLTAEAQVIKHFQIQFNFKNSGSTIAKGTTITISAINPDDGQSQEVFASKEPIDLLPNSPINAVVTLLVPVNSELPPLMKYTVLISYFDVHGTAQKAEIPTIYDSQQNYWTYGK